MRTPLELLTDLMTVMNRHDTYEPGPFTPAINGRIDHYINEVPGLNEWWVRRLRDLQQEQDDKRNAALDKLTEDEARLLGVLAAWHERQHALHIEE